MKIILTAITAAFVFTATSHAAQPRKPNILFILADDQSPFDFKFYNPQSTLESPNIDRLATSGMVFDSACHMGSFSGAVCTPSRHMIMSGRTVWHLPIGPDANKCQPNLEKNTIGAVFNRAGYATMRTCKEGNSYAHANIQFSVVHDATKRGGTAESGSAWHADRVLDYLDERTTKKDDRPFFIYFGLSHPHDERVGTPELLAKYGATNHLDQSASPLAHPKQPPLPPNWLPAHPFDNTHIDVRDEVSVSGVWKRRDEATIRNEIGREYACSENIDIQIGRVLARLESMGELENTYIFYTADHGIAIGRHGLQGKQNLYEHTWRVPMIVKGPGVKPGARAPGNIYLGDLLATFCDLTGVTPPDTNDGISFKPILLGDRKTIRDSLYGVYNGGDKPGMRSVKQGDWKLIEYESTTSNIRETQLFNLMENPHELLADHHDSKVTSVSGISPTAQQINLAKDPKHAAKLAEMRALLLAEMRSHGDPWRFSNQPNDGLSPPSDVTKSPTHKIVAVGDAMIDAGVPTTALGGASEMSIHSDQNGAGKQVYLSFVPNQIAYGYKRGFQTAAIELRLAKPATETHRLVIHGARNPYWNETTINWENAPAHYDGTKRIQGNDAKVLGRFEKIAEVTVSLGDQAIVISDPALLGFMNRKSQELEAILETQEKASLVEEDVLFTFVIAQINPTGSPLQVYSKEHGAPVGTPYNSFGEETPVLSLCPIDPVVKIKSDGRTVTLSGARRLTYYRLFAFPNDAGSGKSARQLTLSRIPGDQTTHLEYGGVLTDGQGIAKITMDPLEPGFVLQPVELSLFAQIGADRLFKHLVEDILGGNGHGRSSAVPGARIVLNSELIRSKSAAPDKGVNHGGGLKTQHASEITQHFLNKEFKKSPPDLGSFCSYWYQTDDESNTQVFRMHRGSHDIGPRIKAGRIEYFEKNNVRKLGQWSSWEGTYTFLKEGAGNLMQTFGPSAANLWNCHIDLGPDNLRVNWRRFKQYGTKNYVIIEENGIVGKTVHLKIMYNGKEFRIYRKRDGEYKLVSMQTYPDEEPNEEGGYKLQFRWGDYGGQGDGYVQRDTTYVITDQKMSNDDDLPDTKEKK